IEITAHAGAAQYRARLDDGRGRRGFHFLVLGPGREVARDDVDRLHALGRLAVHLGVTVEAHDRAVLVDPRRIRLAFPLVAVAVVDHVIGRRHENRAVLAAPRERWT